MKSHHKKIAIVCLLIIIILYWFGFSDEYTRTFCGTYFKGWESASCFLQHVIDNMLDNNIGRLLLVGGVGFSVAWFAAWYNYYRTQNGIKGITKYDMFGLMILSGIISIWFYKIGAWKEIWKFLINLSIGLLIVVIGNICYVLWEVFKEKYFHKK